MENENKIKAGDHIGHVQSWGISKTNAGNPQVFARFDIGLTWWGTLKEGRGREISLESLVVMGFKGDDLADLVRDPMGALDKDKDLRLVVEYEADQSGELKPRIKWINDVAGPMKNQMNETDALAALANLKVAGDLMKIRKDKGVNLDATEPSSDIPF